MGRKGKRRDVQQKKRDKRLRQREAGKAKAAAEQERAASQRAKAVSGRQSSVGAEVLAIAAESSATEPVAKAKKELNIPEYKPSEKSLLKVRDLHTRFRTEAGLANAVCGVSFDVYEGEVLGIVGESGSGKSVTSLSIMRLIPNPPGEIHKGSILFQGKELLDLGWEDMRRIRGKEIAMIFQEPMTALNPVYTVGFQIMEILEHHENLSKPEAFQRGVKLLEEVGIPDAERRMTDYPHQFSGGMRQRVVIAMALACDPSLLIADEPTTALDVTIQAQILELMLKVKAKRKDAAVMLITHDLAVVAETCERVIVMYGGKVQEMAPVSQLFKDPKHPYTLGLLSSLPKPVRGKKERKLKTIPGMVPNIHNFPKGCRFSTRCDVVEDRCHDNEPELHKLGDYHYVRCHLVEGDKIEV
ncbi:MAG: ABC transporter ATP-binding protein [Planctomycetota bacterium]|nr:ABC transporter ATP-binding protein [Planctomycetota bacterium]